MDIHKLFLKYFNYATSDMTLIVKINILILEILSLVVMGFDANSIGLGNYG